MTDIRTKDFNKSLFSKYQGNCPRYTSYPTALRFHDKFGNDELIHAVRNSPHNELSLYVHIPFCQSLCYYCGCNKIITQNQEKLAQYQQTLLEEIRHRAALFERHSVKQVHFGGGTPNYLSINQLEQIVLTIKELFNVAEDSEISIELDPRILDTSYIDHLAALGVNRLSLGIQDTNIEVQQAINRVQSTDKIQHLIWHAKWRGIQTINLDLIYGLPFQSTQSFLKTLQDVAYLDADRISLFGYAHLPNKFAAQRKIKESWLPNTESRLELMIMAAQVLEACGYQQIGIDHFSKPQDPLSQAKKKRQLGRNFQGYIASKGFDLLGLGLTSISHINNVYCQNQKSLSAYQTSIKESKHAVEKGLKLSTEDQLRAYVISELMCNLFIDKKEIEELFEIDFNQHFKDEINVLGDFEQDGILINHFGYIQVFDEARLLVRRVCQVFDQYTHHSESQQIASRII